MRIWLTGGSGTGKSTAAKIFAEHGFVIVDADRISKEIYIPGSRVFESLAEAFPEALDAGTICRRVLGQIVFENRERLAVLNRITHPYIIEEMERQSAGHARVLIDAPLPNTFGVVCDLTVAVSAPIEVRMARIMERDHLTPSEAENRIRSQKSDAEYRAGADAVLYNDGDAAALRATVEAFLSARDLL